MARGEGLEPSECEIWNLTCALRPPCEWCARPDSNRHAVRRQALDLLGLPISPRAQVVSRVGVEPTDDLSVRRGLNAVAKPFAYLPMAEEKGVEPSGLPADSFPGCCASPTSAPLPRMAGNLGVEPS